MSFQESRDRVVKGALVGAFTALAGIAVLAVTVEFATIGPLLQQPYWLVAGYLILVAAISAGGGWLAGRGEGTQPFAAAAVTAMMLGVGGFSLAFLLTALVQDPGWVGTAVAGIAPAGALLGGMIRWSGQEE